MFTRKGTEVTGGDWNREWCLQHMISTIKLLRKNKVGKDTNDDLSVGF
jgi:hypothetical protein